MATDLFLIRKNRQWAKYPAVEALTLTGGTAIYSSVTGSSGTNILTIVGHTLAAGDSVYFQALAGGSSLAVNTTYWVINVSGNTFQLSLTQGGAAASLGSDITSATLIATSDELLVWSAEFRDQFSSTLAAAQISEGASSVPPAAPQMSVPGIGYVDTDLQYGTAGETTLNVTPTIGNLSDEAAHEPLRQTLLKRTHWKFDRGSSAAPRYLYATWADGDIICDTQPTF